MKLVTNKFKSGGLHSFIHSFIHVFYIPLIFTDVELVIYIVSIIGKQVYTVVSYCNTTVSIADKISIHRFCLNVVS